jgi:hypothetical protein
MTITPDAVHRAALDEAIVRGIKDVFDAVEVSGEEWREIELTLDTETWDFTGAGDS